MATGASTGYYIKNVTPFSVGAHEAGHTVEDWLINKHGVGNITSRILPRKLIREAYARAIQTAEGKGKTISQLKAEISIYALKENNSECLSEALADYIVRGTDAALLSKEILNVLRMEL